MVIRWDWILSASNFKVVEGKQAKDARKKMTNLVGLEECKISMLTPQKKTSR